MGSNFATDLAENDLGLSLRDSIAIQLRGNHYPPVPLSMIDPCIEAIEACNDEDYNRLIKLPEGVSWRGEDSAPASAIVEGHHLDAWLNHADWCDCDECIPMDQE
jgi:hypothetical protein